MATSGVTVYNQSVEEVMRMAFFHIGRYGLGRTIDANDYSIAFSILNTMIKAWSADLHLWAKQEGMLFLTPYTSLYSLDDLSSSARFAKLEDTTTDRLTENAAAAATTLEMDTSGLTIGYNIGIVLDTLDLFWTTIATIPDSTSLTITDALPSAASQGRLVYTYSIKANKPMRVLDCRLLSGFDDGSSTSQIELPMSGIAYQDYWQIAATTLNGQYPNQFHYEPKVQNGNFYIWPRPMDCSVRIQLTYERELQDLVSLNNNFDLPVEWLEPLQWQLALRLCPGYGKADRLPMIAQIASDRLQDLKDWDNEINYVQLTPNLQGNQYE